MKTIFSLIVLLAVGVFVYQKTIGRVSSRLEDNVIWMEQEGGHTGGKLPVTSFSASAGERWRHEARTRKASARVWCWNGHEFVQSPKGDFSPEVLNPRAPLKKLFAGARWKMPIYEDREFFAFKDPSPLGRANDLLLIFDRAVGFPVEISYHNASNQLVVHRFLFVKTIEGSDMNLFSDELKGDVLFQRYAAHAQSQLVQREGRIAKLRAHLHNQKR